MGQGFARYAVGAYLLGGACGSLFGPPDLAFTPPQGFAGFPIPEPMSLIPRWRFMTDEAKALTKVEYEMLKVLVKKDKNTRRDWRERLG